MQIVSSTRRRPLARMLALVALLCTASLQLQEASHGHGLDLHESYSECLLCKSSGPVAAMDDSATTGLTAAARPLGVTVVKRPRLAPPQAFLARGPPTHA